jgi:hypothetical protein
MDFSFKLSDILLHEPTQQSQRSKPKVKAKGQSFRDMFGFRFMVFRSLELKCVITLTFPIV